MLAFINDNVDSQPISVQNEVQKIADGGINEFIGYYGVEDLTNVQSEGNLLLNFAYDSLPDSVFVFKARDVDYSFEEYYWYGESRTVDENSVGHMYYFHLSSFSSGDYVLSMNMDGYRFKGVKVGSNVLAVFKYNDYLFESGCDAHDNILEDTLVYDPINHLAMKNCNSNCPVDVLVLYTPEAKAKESTVEYLIRSEFRQMQTVLKNSGVDECHVKMRIVGMVANFDFPKSNYNYNKHNGANSTMNRLINLNIGNIKGLRTQYGADIVLVIDDGEVNKIGGISEGYSANEILLESRQYILMGVENLGSAGYSMAHHFGHMFSAHHQKNSVYSAGNYFHYAFPGLKNRYTIMRAWPEDKLKKTKQRVPFFSNPYVDLYYNGPKTGAADRAAAFAFINGGCKVADMVTPIIPEPFTAYITGDKIACPCMNTMLDVTVNGVSVGNNVISYEWSTSSDGINFSNVLSTVPNYSVQASCITNEVVFVKVKVTVGTNVAESIATIRTQNAIGGIPCTQKKEFTDVNSDVHNDEIKIFPNPVKSVIEIQGVENLLSTNFTVYSIDGKKVMGFYETVNEDTDIIKLNVSELQNGVYVLQFQDAKGILKSYTFIKQK